MTISVKSGDKIKAGGALANHNIQQEKIVDVSYRGSPKVAVGETIEKGMCLYTKGKFIPKKIFSEVTGIVKEISKDSIKIAIKDKSPTFSQTDLKASFDSEVISVSNDEIILKFPSLHINLFGSKGEPSIGPISYIESSNIKAGKIDESKVKGSIIITEKITLDIYPLLSTLGAKGIIGNSIDYYLYRDMIILAVPVGIISGFGNLNEDVNLKKYFKDNEKKWAWLDTSYDRLVVVENDCPPWAKDYKFDLEKIGIA